MTSETEIDRLDERRCQGCADLVAVEKLNNISASANRRVRYCNRCERLRDTYDIHVEDHEQYCLLELADKLAEEDDGS